MWSGKRYRILGGILLIMIFGFGFSSVKEYLEIPYINDGTADWTSIEEIEIYACGSQMPPTVVITDDDVIAELVSEVRKTTRYKKVPESRYREGMNERWVRFDNGVVIGMYGRVNYGNIGTEPKVIGGPYYEFPERFYERVRELADAS